MKTSANKKPGGRKRAPPAPEAQSQLPAIAADTPPSLRERHQDATRDLIVDALVAMLESEGVFEFSMFELARRSGVSVRTIYRHFPTRESLFDAVSARVNARVGLNTYPHDPEGIVALVRALFPAFDRQAALIKAQMQTGLGRQVRTHAQKLRLEAIIGAVARAAPALSPERARQLGGAISCLMSADSWLRLKNTLDMDGEEAGDVIAWAIQTLFEGVRAENERVTRSKKGARKE